MIHESLIVISVALCASAAFANHGEDFDTNVSAALEQTRRGAAKMASVTPGEDPIRLPGPDGAQTRLTEEQAAKFKELAEYMESALGSTEFKVSAAGVRHSLRFTSSSFELIREAALQAKFSATVFDGRVRDYALLGDDRVPLVDPWIQARLQEELAFWTSYRTRLNDDELAKLRRFAERLVRQGQNQSEHGKLHGHKLMLGGYWKNGDFILSDYFIDTYGPAEHRIWLRISPKDGVVRPIITMANTCGPAMACWGKVVQQELDFWLRQATLPSDPPRPPPPPPRFATR